MKLLLIILLAISSSFNGFAQKSKNKSPEHRSYKAIPADYVCPEHSGVHSKTPGKCPKCNMDLTLSKKEQMKRDVVKNYTCPMHAQVVSDKPGKCPMCNKDLTASKKEQFHKVYFGFIFQKYQQHIGENRTADQIKHDSGHV